MSQLARIILIGLAVVAFSCKNRTEAGMETDKAVMNEIFPSLIDSMYVEILFAMRPPPVEEAFDSVSSKTVIRPSDKTELFKERIRNELIEQKKDPATFTIVLNDTIHPLARNEKLKFQSKYVLSENSFDKGCKIDLDAQIQPAGFKIVLSSTYKPTGDPFERVLKELSFSRIVFNKEQNKGMLTGEYACGGLCGNGYRIFIKQVQNKWVIDYIEHAWVE